MGHATNSGGAHAQERSGTPGKPDTGARVPCPICGEGNIRRDALFCIKCFSDLPFVMRYKLASRSRGGAVDYAIAYLRAELQRKREKQGVLW